MFTGTSLEFKVNDTEWVYNVDKPYASSPSHLKVHIPILMANIPRGLPDTSKTSINRNIFCNDSSCRVNPSSLVTTQNYITIGHHKNESPDFTIVEDWQGRMTRYNKILAEIPNGDIRNIRFTHKMDKLEYRYG